MFYLFANCNFIPDHYDAWQAAYDDLAAHVEPNEPTTMTYYFGIPLDYADDFSKTTSMLAFEDLYETHLGSPAMTKFLETIPGHTTTDLDLNHYSCIGGFLDRDGDEKDCGVMLDQKIVCKSLEARRTVAENLKNLVDTVSRTEKSSPSGVLTIMAFECLDNDTGARIYSRFANGDAMENFIRRDDVNAFWQSVKADVRGMEQRGYLPNGKGWLHRGGDTPELGAKL